MAAQIFTKSSPSGVFVVLFVNCGTPIKIGPRNFLGLKTSIFGQKIRTPPYSDNRCAETRTNSGKTKTSHITACLGYPHIDDWWNSVRRNLSYTSPIVHFRHRDRGASFDRQCNTNRISSPSSQTAESMAFPTVRVALLGIITPVS